MAQECKGDSASERRVFYFTFCKTKLNYNFLRTQPEEQPRARRRGRPGASGRARGCVLPGRPHGGKPAVRPSRRRRGSYLEADPASQTGTPAASLQKSLPRLHDWISAPSPTAASERGRQHRGRGGSPAPCASLARPLRLIGPPPKVEESHWAVELLAKAPSLSRRV